MSESKEAVAKPSWKERRGRLLRGALIVGGLAVGAAVIF